MKTKKLTVRCAGLLCALLTAAAAAAPCFADTDTTSTAAADITAADSTAQSTTETAARQTDSKTYTSGDYEYTFMKDRDDAEADAEGICIERYLGSDTDVVIPGELDGQKVVSLGDYAFTENRTLNAVTIPASVTEFGLYAFAACTGMKEYRADAASTFCMSRDGVLYSKDGTYLLRYPISRLGEELTVEEGIAGIGDVAFSEAVQLKRVTLPSTLEAIGLSAFSGCTGLDSIVIPDKVTSIPAFCFVNCSGLQEVTLPKNLTVIGPAAFTSTGLTSVTLPDTLTEIGQQAFANTKLIEVTIPASVTDIGYSAFGWRTGKTNELFMDSSFTIRGYAGSYAQIYSKDQEDGNDFIFVALDAPETTTAPAAAESGKHSAGKIIAVVAGCLLLAAVIAAAVISELRRKKPGLSKSQRKRLRKQAAKAAEGTETPAAEQAESEVAENDSESAEPDEGRESN